jgi:hypothetical protein
MYKACVMKRLVGNVLQLTAATDYCLLYNWDFLCENPNYNRKGAVCILGVNSHVLVLLQISYSTGVVCWCILV